MDDHGVFTELRRYNRARGIAFRLDEDNKNTRSARSVICVREKIRYILNACANSFLRDRAHAISTNIYRARLYDIYLGACAYNGKFNAPVKIHIIFIRTQNVNQRAPTI